MPYVRLSIVKPRPGQSAHVQDLMQKLNEFSLTHSGCESSMVLKPHDNSGEIARITIYDNEITAEQIANTDHVLALRSELHLASEPGHVERAFFSE